MFHNPISSASIPRMVSFHFPLCGSFVNRSLAVVWWRQHWLQTQLWLPYTLTPPTPPLGGGCVRAGLSVAKLAIIAISRVFTYKLCCVPYVQPKLCFAPFDIFNSSDPHTSCKCSVSLHCSNIFVFLFVFLFLFIRTAFQPSLPPSCEETVTHCLTSPFNHRPELGIPPSYPSILFLFSHPFLSIVDQFGSIRWPLQWELSICFRICPILNSANPSFASIKP